MTTSNALAFLLVTKVDEKLSFSLTRRPAPYTRAPWMSLLSGGTTDSEWDQVMFQLARWLVRHLNDPALILWLTKRGGRLHERWVWMIDNELDRFARLEREGKTAELEEHPHQCPECDPAAADADTMAPAVDWSRQITAARSGSLPLEGSAQSRWPEHHASLGITRVAFAQNRAEEAFPLGRER